MMKESLGEMEKGRIMEETSLFQRDSPEVYSRELVTSVGSGHARTSLGAITRLPTSMAGSVLHICGDEVMIRSKPCLICSWGAEIWHFHASREQRTVSRHRKPGQHPKEDKARRSRHGFGSLSSGQERCWMDVCAEEAQEVLRERRASFQRYLQNRIGDLMKSKRKEDIELRLSSFGCSSAWQQTLSIRSMEIRAT